MYPGGEPTSRDTECFSMYSDMSIRTIASSSPNRNSASVRPSSVLPTPEGPRKMNEPVRRFLELLRLDRGLLVAPRGLDLLLELAVHGRRGHRLDAGARGGLVDQVDRLVGQEAVGDVAVRKLGRVLERLVGDAH